VAALVFYLIERGWHAVVVAVAVMKGMPENSFFEHLDAHLLHIGIGTTGPHHNGKAAYSTLEPCSSVG
jgi:pyrimidine deaminase RibD-like protein